MPQGSMPEESQRRAKASLKCILSDMHTAYTAAEGRLSANHPNATEFVVHMLTFVQSSMCILESYVARL